MREIAYAWRTLRSSPWYAASVIAVLAMAMTLAVVAVELGGESFFASLPYRSPEHLFLVRGSTSTSRPHQLPPLAGREIAVVRQLLPEISSTAVAASATDFPLDGRSYNLRLVDEHFFSVLGITPALGSFEKHHFDGDGTQLADQTARRAVIISDRLWRRHFAADRGVVGRAILISHRRGRAYTVQIVGVLPSNFVFPIDEGVPQPDLLAPLGRAALENSRRELQLLLQVPTEFAAKTEQMLRTARARIAELPPSAHLAHAGGQEEGFQQLELESVSAHIGRQHRRTVWLLLAGTGILLLLACVNVAGLAAARTLDRWQHLAIQRALGASRWQLARKISTEIVLLVAAATALAALLAIPLLKWTTAILPEGLLLSRDPGADLGPFLTAAAVGVCGAAIVALSQVVAGVYATSSSSHQGVSLRPRVSSRTVTPRGRLAYSGLVTAQVSVGLVLLIAGALTVASFAVARTNEIGYRLEEMVLMESHVRKYVSPSDAIDQLDRAYRALATLPFVKDVAASTVQSTFLRPNRVPATIVAAGLLQMPEGILSRHVTGNFFEVMGIRLVEGRWPTDGEWRDGAHLALVSHTAARRLWPNRSSVGKVLISTDPRATGFSWTVIGVVADARFVGYDIDPTGDVYLPGAISPGRTGLLFHVRTTREGDDLLLDLTRHATAAGLRVDRIATHSAGLAATVDGRVFPAWIFGLIALATTAILLMGVSGLLAMSVAGQKTEIAVRLALGASRSNIIVLLLGMHTAAVLRGIGIGIVLTLWTVDVLASLLYRVTPRSPLVWLFVIGALLVLSTIVALVPAVRGARTDPALALKAR